MIHLPTAFRPLFVPAALGLAALLAPNLAAVPPDLDDPFARIPLRHIGPAGNRVTAVAGVPGDPLVYYAGSASGGIFATRDGGTTWAPIFDDTPAASIGALAVAPGDPNVVWAGTGEAFLRSNVSLGDGMYRSTDAGRTWTKAGLGSSGRIARIAVHPRDPDTVWAAALGHCWGPQPERGVFRTRDGGATWEHVLAVDEHTGAVDVVLDPTNPRILYAATWQIRMWTAGRESGGPGSGIWRSTDSGDTWVRLGPANPDPANPDPANADPAAEIPGAGLPGGPWGRIGLALSAADPRRVYALIETSTNPDFAPAGDFGGVLWRSDDRGETWKAINADHSLTQRPLYYTRAVVAPDDALEVTFLAVDQLLSHDGGATTVVANSGWDHHDLWIDPLDGDRRISGHDGGISITRNRGETWDRPLLPNAQMYRVATDRRIPYRVYGNRQDGSSAMGPSDTLSGEVIPVGAWRTVGGCEVGFTLPDPAEPERVWTGCYDGILHLYDDRTGVARDVSVWPLAIESWPAAELRYRIQWEAPLAISPHDPATVYYGSHVVHRTRDGGHSWEVISPDLTGADPELMRRTGGLTLDDAGPSVAPAVVAIAESPVRAGRLWAGTNDGRISTSGDGGATWTDRTPPETLVPPLGTVSAIEPSPHDGDTAWAVVDRHEEGDFRSWVLVTRDAGSTWSLRRGDLPQDAFAFAHSVREDPEVPGLLYLGTEGGLWTSLDAGGTWLRLRGLPPVPVYWLEVQPHFGDLAVATYGRGFWILDDLGPLRARAAEGPPDRPRLLPPRPAYRFLPRESAWEEEASAAAGRNPERGALVHYELPEAVGKGDVALRISDPAGRTVRELRDLGVGAGLHRTVWDLHGEKTPEVRLRTRPADRPRYPMQQGAFRELSDGGRFTRFLDPGTYGVELVIGGQVVDRVDLEVVPDPGVDESVADRQARSALLDPLESWIRESAERIGRAEWLRRQLADLRAVLEAADADAGAPGVADAVDPGSGAGPADPGAADPEVDLLAAIAELDDAIAAWEGRFFDLRLTDARQDTLRWKRLLYSRLVTLADTVQASHRAPTAAQREVFELLGGEVEAAREAWTRLVEEAIPAFERRAAVAGVGAVVLPAEDPSEEPPGR